MIYKSKSVKFIINKVFRDLGMTISQHTDVLTDMIEWAGEALEGIGGISPTEDKSATIKIKDSRGVLPCDLYLINQVCYNGHPLKYGSQTFNFAQHCEDCVNQHCSSFYSYTVNPNYINSDVPSGDCVTIYYKAFPVDEEGFPLVPDNYSYSEAIFWFIVYKLIMRGFEHPNKEMTLSFANMQWLKYCTQAENQSKMFDISQAESFKNQWVRLIPNVNPGATFHADANVPETLTRDSRRRYSQL